MNMNRILIELSESDRTDFGKVEFSTQSEEQKVFSAIWSLESQVNNGGFFQYFISWDGDTANYAPFALKRIGANASAVIVERAIAAVSTEQIPTEHDAREQLMVALNADAREKLETLSSEFYAYPDNLTELLYQYVESHPETFGIIQPA